MLDDKHYLGLGEKVTSSLFSILWGSFFYNQVHGFYTETAKSIALVF
jgi:hypothetical protein